MSPTSLGQILKLIIQEKKWEDRFRVRAVWELWDEIVGETVAREAQPKSFKQGCLWVGVSDPMWMHHLQISKETIRQNLNSKLGSELVKSIRFTLVSPARTDDASPENTPGDHGK